MNIYVGNLSRTTTEEALRNLFEQHGEVASVRIMKDKFTGEVRGFAFVTMPADEQAQQAISALNGTEVEGRKLTVNEAREPERRPSAGGNRFGGPRGGGMGGSRGGGMGGGNGNGPRRKFQY
jgi:RNA recognition motif-containing protein